LPGTASRKPSTDDDGQAGPTRGGIEETSSLKYTELDVHP
jgi:hypothetical protein